LLSRALVRQQNDRRVRISAVLRNSRAATQGWRAREVSPLANAPRYARDGKLIQEIALNKKEERNRSKTIALLW